jgi:predicted kinase
VDLVIFAGLPASGKSTFFRARFAATHRHMSKDLMRNVRRKGQRQVRLIEEALEAGESVVVDNVNASVADRAELIALGRARGARIVGYHFDARVPECLERNARRQGREPVPAVAVHAAAKRWEPPSYAEGFDRLYRVRIGGAGDFDLTQQPELATFLGSD